MAFHLMNFNDAGKHEREPKSATTGPARVGVGANPDDAARVLVYLPRDFAAKLAALGYIDEETLIWTGLG